MTEFRMPALGADMEAGTLVAWRSKPGDKLARGDIIAEVETDKGVIEVEVWSAGVLERYLVEPGQKVPVGTPLAILRDDAHPASTPAPGPAAISQAPISSEPAPALVSAPAPPLDERVRISPAARRRARELGVDPSRVQGQGRGGVVTLEDIEHAATAPGSPLLPTAARGPAPASKTSPNEARRALRRAIAASMTRAKREIPHYYVSTNIDFGPASAWLEAYNARHDIHERLLAGVLLLKAAALAAQRMPELNARWQNDEAAPSAAVHLGVAVSLRGGGLVAPAIHDADRKSLSELMAALQDVTARARAGTLRSSELSDATMTVTSLGERGVDAVFPIIHPPQTCIVGFGRITPRPWALGQEVAVRPVVTATLAADHRVTDGHTGARFLALIETLLQEPTEL